MILRPNGVQVVLHNHLAIGLTLPPAPRWGANYGFMVTPGETPEATYPGPFGAKTTAREPLCITRKFKNYSVIVIYGTLH